MKSHNLTPVVLVLLVAIAGACNRTSSPVAPVSLASPASVTSTRGLAPGNESTMSSVGFLEERVKGDPDDIVALNKLSGYYLQLHRETDDIRYLEHALRAAQSSLRVLPADQNLGGLRALAQAEYETHNFVLARAHAEELTQFAPRRSFGFQLLGDALRELGDYEKATAAYRKMEELEPGTVATKTRLAHLAILKGETEVARKKYMQALAQARADISPTPEIIAWCYWQLGEVARGSGQHEAAAGFYRDALKVFPEYAHAVSSLAQLRASQGELNEALGVFERIVAKRPDPHDAATLGDLYKLKGREREAQDQYSTVERLSKSTALQAALYNRHLVLFWADRDMKVEEAYELAKKEYDTRRDIYGADALAWAALKAGKIEEADAAIRDALRLGTQDAHLFYHAGMIARAKGDSEAAADFLRRTLKLDKHFDLLQSRIATAVLAEMGRSSKAHWSKAGGA